MLKVSVPSKTNTLSNEPSSKRGQQGCTSIIPSTRCNLRKTSSSQKLLAIFTTSAKVAVLLPRANQFLKIPRSWTAFSDAAYPDYQ
jgi:hypothetical protein